MCVEFALRHSLLFEHEMVLLCNFGRNGREKHVMSVMMMMVLMMEDPNAFPWRHDANGIAVQMRSGGAHIINIG